MLSFSPMPNPVPARTPEKATKSLVGPAGGLVAVPATVVAVKLVNEAVGGARQAAPKTAIEKEPLVGPSAPKTIPVRP